MLVLCLMFYVVGFMLTYNIDNIQHTTSTTYNIQHTTSTTKLAIFFNKNKQKYENY